VTVTLSPDEIKLIRASNLLRNASRRPEFMELASEVCEMMGVTFAKVSGVTRGNNAVCEARALICRIAFDRGFHPHVIAQYIRRDRTSVLHSVARTKEVAGE
jgi:hypothetical protein